MKAALRVRCGISAGRYCLYAIVLLPTILIGQDYPTIRFGGGYEDLTAEQQTLVRDWHEEYAKVTGNRIDPKAGYDNLKLSVRSTFEAVTNALLKTELTDSEGKPLGTALSLVKLVESVHGEIPQTRGDEQYRVYVRLQDDALKKLYESTQFRRTADNGIYHIGYPINFRLQGGAPSIQFSITRTGLRADVDVDYRSSGGPQALINGHLTAANSDIRAGNNYLRHTGRWHGLRQWWHGLFGLAPAIPKRDLAALSSGYRKPAVGDSQPVQAAVLDFYKSWLLQKTPELSLSYISVKANACIAAFPGEDARDSLISLRLLQHMIQSNKEIGDVKDLNEVLHGIVLLDQGAQPVQHSDGKLFAISALPDSLARRIDCRQVRNISLAEDLPEATGKMGDYYSSSTVIRGPNDTGPGQLVYMVWHKEEGTWKVVSWYLENPFADSVGPRIATKDTSEKSGAKASADPRLETTSEQFLKTWLISRDIAAALKSVAPEARTCANLGRTNDKQPALSEQAWFQEVANQMPRADTLAGTIQHVEFSHSQMQEVNHPEQNAYLLVRISDDLASMYNCAARSAGEKPGPADAMGKAFYTLKAYQTMFQPRHKIGDRGTVVLTWAQRQKQWMVIAFDVVTY